MSDQALAQMVSEHLHQEALLLLEAMAEVSACDERKVLVIKVERCVGGTGIRSAMGAVVGLCSRWETGNLRQRACDAMGLWDCTVGTWRFYTDPVSPAALFEFLTRNLAVW